MPYLQLDTPYSHSIGLKQRFAQRVGEIYAQHMGTRADRVTVAIRELGVGGVWRCSAQTPPRPAALLMCDIRRGRPVEQRAELARLLVAACCETLELTPDCVNVAFTQHAGDEMYHPMFGGLSEDWTEGEGR